MLGLRLMLMLRLLLLLLVLQQEATSDEEYEKPIIHIPERCKYLRDTNELMHQKCKGKFPLVAYTKFRDTFMKQTDRMALFMPESLDYVMVALKESELHNCKSIQLVQVHQYLCFDQDGDSRYIYLKSVRMYCFPFHIQLTDDLMHECILERDGVSGSALEVNVLRTKRGIVHYTFDNDSAMRYLVPKQIYILLTILVQAVLLYF